MMQPRILLMSFLMLVGLKTSEASEPDIFDFITDRPVTYSSVSLIEILSAWSGAARTARTFESQDVECTPADEPEVLEILTSSMNQPDLVTEPQPEDLDAIECERPYYDSEEAVLYIPCIEVSDGQGGKLTFKTSWTIIPDREILSLEIREEALVE